MFLLQIGLVVGPLLGWGLTDLVEFARNPARAGVVLIAMASAALVSRQPTRIDPFARGVGPRSFMNSALLMIGVFSLPAVLAWFAFADRRSVLVTADLAFLRYAGLAMYAAGEAIRLLALRALGKQYSAYVTIQPDHQLVRSGIYRLVRHPFYVGQILAIPGTGLAFRNLLAGPILVFSVLFVLRRIRSEEELLGRQFPAEFPAYQRATWRLIPFVY